MFKQFGSSVAKFSFLVNVKTIVLLDMQDELEYGDTLCVSLERKNKVVYTAEKPVGLNHQDEIVCEIGESLSTSATLYKDNKGGWKHKTATLSVLQRKKGIAGLSSNNKEAFKTIGLVSLPLHVLADGKVHEMDLTLGWCKSQTAYVEVVVSSAISDKDSDANSVDDEGSVSRRQKSRPSPMEPLREDEEADDSSHISSHTKSASIGGTLGGFFGSSTSKATLEEIDKLHKKITELENALLVSADIVEYERNRAKEASFRAAKAEDEVEALRGQTARNSKIESTNSKLIEQYENELRRLNDEIKRLQVMNEVNLTKVSRSEASVSSQVKMLQQEVEKLREENARLQQERASLAPSLSQSSEENLRMKSLMSKASDEIDRLTEERLRLEALLQGKADENQVLLNELIQAKLAVGEINEELDQAKQTIKKLKGGTTHRPSVGSNNSAGSTPYSNPQSTPIPPRQQQQQQQHNNNNGVQQRPTPFSTPSMPYNTPQSTSTQRSSMLVGFPTGESKKPSNPFADVTSNMKRGFDTMSSGISTLGSTFRPSDSTPGSQQMRSQARSNW